MRNALSLILATVVWFILYGCTKPKTEATEYTFENLADKTMNVDIYATQDDYYNNTNLVAHGTAQVRGYYVVPFSSLTLNKVYYVDIYSDDYSYTNWFWNNTTLRDTFTPSKASYNFIIQHTQISDPSRQVWLNGAGPSTTWKAFNAYTYSGSTYTSVWSTLTADQQSLTMQLKKSSHALITTDSHSMDTTLSFIAYYDQTTNKCTLTLLNSDKSTYGGLTGFFNPATYAFNGSKDTMLANISGLGFFAMARQ